MAAPSPPPTMDPVSSTVGPAVAEPEQVSPDPAASPGTAASSEPVITFDPDLPRAQVERLEELAADNPYLLVSPMAGLPSPVVASAWGVQVPLDDVDDRRLEAFLVRYQQGPQTPEPGAPCRGGTSALPDAPTGENLDAVDLVAPLPA